MEFFFNSVTSQIYQAIALAVGEIAIRSMVLIDEFCDRISITVENSFCDRLLSEAMHRAY